MTMIENALQMREFVCILHPRTRKPSLSLKVFNPSTKLYLAEFKNLVINIEKMLWIFSFKRAPPKKIHKFSLTHPLLFFNVAIIMTQTKIE